MSLWVPMKMALICIWKTITNFEWVREWDWLLNVTSDDISVIYVKAHRCPGGLKKFDLLSGSQSHSHLITISTQLLISSYRLFSRWPRLTRQRNPDWSVTSGVPLVPRNIDAPRGGPTGASAGANRAWRVPCPAERDPKGGVCADLQLPREGQGTYRRPVRGSTCWPSTSKGGPRYV